MKVISAAHAIALGNRHMRRTGHKVIKEPYLTSVKKERMIWVHCTEPNCKMTPIKETQDRFNKEVKIWPTN